jgi:hypothetical protein
MNDAVTGPPPGTRPKRNPNPLPRGPPVRQRRPQAADALGDEGAFDDPLDVAQYLRHSEQPDDDGQKLNAGGKIDRPEGEALAAVDDVDANRGSEKSERHHQSALHRRAGDHEKRANDAEHHQGEILRRSETNGDRRDRRRKERHHDHAECAGDERADRRDTQCRAGAPLLRHLVTVETGHDRRGLARDVQKD